MHDEEKLKKLMEHPVFLAHDSHARIIRAQLFFVAFSTIFLIWSEVKIGDESSILGIRLDGLTTEHVLLIVLFLLSYQIVHFLWISWESILEWRIRQTALDTGGWGGGGIKISSKDPSEKVRQTTLYAYLKDVVHLDIDKIRSSSTDESSIKINDISQSLSSIKNILESERISDSLWRFDNWFKMFYKAQNCRWLFLDFLLPLVLGVVAIALVIKVLFFQC
ncbi:hypothetical protein [Azonexus sp.]|uniref:hypothetical protein n=1 Tax=Azonexus sp. TaxID=1872668 RepID=UPI0027BA7681|nr:hypothetical protein [Azonexus sp.]